MTARKLTCGSLFDGIGCFSLAFVRAGFDLRWSVEIDPQCRRVTRERFPGVRQYEDVRHVGSEDLEPVDVVFGGFPCQDLSVAGRRAGLAGERSGLWGEFRRVVEEVRPRWVLVENVVGLLSSDAGRDVGAILWQLGQLGFWWAYRVLDAQYDGLAQRRKRVFVVGRAGDLARLGGEQSGEDAGRLRGLPCRVLFEPESVFRDTPPRRGEGTDAARGAEAGPGGDVFSANGADGCGRGTPIIPIDMRQASRGEKMTNNRAEGPSGGAPGTGVGEAGGPCPSLAETHTPAVAVGAQCHGSNVGPMGTLRRGNGNEQGGVPFVAEVVAFVHPRQLRSSDSSNQVGIKPGATVSDAMTSEGPGAVAFHVTQDPVSGPVAPALGKGSEQGCATAGVAYAVHGTPASEVASEADVAASLRSRTPGQMENSTTNVVGSGTIVRRLTPTECLRLQGLPDDWLDVEPPLSDGAKYRFIGNGGSVPTVLWIASRIAAAEEGRL